MKKASVYSLLGVAALVGSLVGSYLLWGILLSPASDKHGGTSLSQLVAAVAQEEQSAKDAVDLVWRWGIRPESCSVTVTNGGKLPYGVCGKLNIRDVGSVIRGVPPQDLISSEVVCTGLIPPMTTVVKPLIFLADLRQSCAKYAVGGFPLSSGCYVAWQYTATIGGARP